MKTKDIVRIIVWGVLSLLCFTSGFVGLYNNLKKTSLTDESKEKLNTLINNFNSNTTVTNYKASSVLYSAKLKRNNIEIVYSDNTKEEKYTLIYDETNNLLKFEFNTNDDIAWNISKLMVDSVSIALGKEEMTTFDTFEKIKKDGTSMDNAFKFISNENTTKVEISTIYGLKVIQTISEVIDTNTLLQNVELLKTFNYKYLDDNMSLTVYKKDNFNYINITQKNELNANTYTNITNIIYYIYGMEELNKFKENYPTIDPNIKEFDNYKISILNNDDMYSIIIEINDKNVSSTIQ